MQRQKKLTLNIIYIIYIWIRQEKKVDFLNNCSSECKTIKVISHIKLTMQRQKELTLNISNYFTVISCMNLILRWRIRWNNFSASSIHCSLKTLCRRHSLDKTVALSPLFIKTSDEPGIHFLVYLHDRPLRIFFYFSDNFFLTIHYEICRRANNVPRAGWP